MGRVIGYGQSLSRFKIMPTGHHALAMGSNGLFINAFTAGRFWSRFFQSVSITYALLFRSLQLPSRRLNINEAGTACTQCQGVGKAVRPVTLIMHLARMRITTRLWHNKPNNGSLASTKLIKIYCLVDSRQQKYLHL